LELRHYDVQILGGLILHDGRLAEMATGEGKTLVATLPCYVNALASTTTTSTTGTGGGGGGSKSLVVTVNDYLARRDMEKMGQVHRFLGLTVGLIQSSMTEEQRRKAYACDVVYVTNSELGFDYLRDHLALTPEQTVLPRAMSAGGGSLNSGGFDAFCIVDEADSVLIDEARTPLIISKQVPAPANKYAVANQLGQALKKDVHYTVDLKNKNIILTEQGYRESEKALGVDSLFSIDAAGSAWAPYVSNAVKAKELFNKDVEYTILKEPSSGESTGVGIIDAFTGRVLDGRRWSDGLHQSIEAKEGINVSEQSKVIAKVTYQSLFRQFNRLAGMTGTATADALELEQTYGLKVTPVPTALPVARRDYPDVAFKTRKAANEALVKECANVGGGRPGGRPCLIGTTSVAQSEQLIEALAAKGIKAELLNASPKNAPRESEIIAQAGRAGIVTVATNMAGRGTDIMLGGCSTTMSRIKTRSVLLEQGVVSAEQAKTLPPSPSEDYFPCDIDDEVMDMLKEAASSIKAAFGPDLTGIELDELLTVAFDTTEAEDDPDYIVKMRDAAEAVKETYAPVLEEEKELVRQAGGLYVMGTNRHESSRIDQQLRGRAGRQGDSGSSRLFLSFEDDMFVVFGGDSLKKMLTMFRVSDDMPVEAPQVTEALDKVQNAVEEKYREIRKEIFNFDEVLNTQRRVIYNRRQSILYSTPDASLKMTKEYNEKTVDSIVRAQTDSSGIVNVAKVLQKIGQFFPPVASLLDASDLSGLDEKSVSKYINVAVDAYFCSKIQSMPNLGRSANYITLVTMDNAWSDHLQALENLKESVLLLKYQGRDPISEYQNQAFQLFQGLEETMRFNAVFSLWQSFVAQRAAATVTAA
jgi:preprotein translocase subunit SecA